MLTLYYKPTCPFSQDVLIDADVYGMSFDLKDVTDSTLEAELIEKGGRDQTPFLVDSETGVMLYESQVIIDYLHQQYLPLNSS